MSDGNLEGLFLLLAMGSIIFLPLVAVIRSLLWSWSLDEDNKKAKIDEVRIETELKPKNQASSLGSVNGNVNNWRCACSDGFLPPGMFGNAEAVLRMGSGQCYHKKRE